MSSPHRNGQISAPATLPQVWKMEDIKCEFLQAIRGGNESCVKEILKLGVIDVNNVVTWNDATTQAGNQQQRRPLKSWNKGNANNYHDVQYECACNNALHQAAAEGQSNICKILIHDGNATVNIQNPDGDSPIHLAAAAGKLEACRVLIIDGKANVNLQNNIGNTPLHRAVDGSHADVCKLLIKDGKAKVNLQNQFGTALHRAAGNNQTEICRLLIEYGNANVNAKNKFDDTPLQRAVYEKQMESCRILIEEGDAKVNEWNNAHDTPLHTAAIQNSPEICQLLIQMGKADVNIKNSDGNTPLHHATRRNHAHVAKILLELGDAEIDIKNAEQKTALDYRFDRKDHREIFKSTLNIVTKHKRMQTKSQPVKRVKLFMCGNHDVGKTTLMNSMSTVKGFFSSLLASESVDTSCPGTPGIRVELKKISGAGRFVIWDMAGQVELHITQAMFLGKSKGIFIVAYNGHSSKSSMAELMYWLRFLKAGHNPKETKPKVVIVGTHKDQIKNVELAKKMAQSTLDKLVEKYGEYLDIHPEAVLLDARKRSGRVLDILKETLNQMAEPWRADMFPNICDEISKEMHSCCQQGIPLLKWPEFVDKVKTIDPLADEGMVKRAVRYLHDAGLLFHAKIADNNDVIILDVNWLASKIFCPIFAKHDYNLDHPGLRNQMEYTRKDLEDQINMSDPEMLVDLLLHFELAYCHNRDGVETFHIPAKLPEGVAEIDWQPDPSSYFRYTGFRIECQDITDMFSVDTFPCIQVHMMNKYCQAGDTPILSRHGLKLFDQAEGMIQLTLDKRAIHIAVREKLGVHQDAKKQLLEMKAIVLDELKGRSIGTRIRVSWLSSESLKTSANLVDDVDFFSEEQVERAEKNGSPLVSKKRLVPVTVHSVKGCLATNQSNADVNLNSIVPHTSRTAYPPHSHQPQRYPQLVSHTGHQQNMPEPIYYNGLLQQYPNELNGSLHSQPMSLVPSHPAGIRPSYQADTQHVSYYSYSSLQSASRHMVPNQRSMTASPSLQNLLVDSFHPLVASHQHSLTHHRCDLYCPWTCIPLPKREETYELIDKHLHSNDIHCRDYRPMAEAFGITDNEFTKIPAYQSRDLSLSATIIKVAFNKRVCANQEPLSIQEVLTIIKHPGIVGSEAAAKVIESFLADNNHHGPHNAYKLDYGISNEVLLHRAVLKGTRHQIREYIRASNIATYLAEHISEDDSNEILRSEDNKFYNYPRAVDLLVSVLMKLTHSRWYKPLLETLQYDAPIIAQVLMEERTRLLEHPAFSAGVAMSEVEETVDQDLAEEEVVSMDELFRQHSVLMVAPKSLYENTAYERDTPDEDQR